MKRGDIYLADLEPRSGSEQRGTRPVVLVSHDGFNLEPAWHSMIVVPVSTSSTQAKRGPTSIPLPVGAGGLKKASVRFAIKLRHLIVASFSITSDTWKCGCCDKWMKV